MRERRTRERPSTGSVVGSPDPSRSFAVLTVAQLSTRLASGLGHPRRPRASLVREGAAQSDGLGGLMSLHGEAEADLTENNERAIQSPGIFHQS